MSTCFFDNELLTGFHIFYVGTFLILINSTFSFLKCYMDACGYIKKVWIVDYAINAL